MTLRSWVCLTLSSGNDSRLILPKCHVGMGSAKMCLPFGSHASHPSFHGFLVHTACPVGPYSALLSALSSRSLAASFPPVLKAMNYVSQPALFVLAQKIEFYQLGSVSKLQGKAYFWSCSAGLLCNSGKSLIKIS